MRKAIIFILFLMPLAAMAQQSSFDKFKQQQQDKFNTFKKDKQAEYDEFRRKQNEEYAEFMRRAWKQFDAHQPDMPIQEKEVPPVIYNEPQPDDKTKPQPDDKTKPQPDDDTKPITSPILGQEVKPQPIAVKPVVVVIPKPGPAPEPIAPVKPKDEVKTKRLTVNFYGSPLTMSFPANDNLRLASLSNNAIADGWQQLADSKYDVLVKSALDIRKSARLCDWAYLELLRAVSEKQYGKTNTAVLVQAFVMSQSGYKIRLAMSDSKLYMLIASQHNIYRMSYFTIDGDRFYQLNDDESTSLRICESKFDKEKSLQLQIRELPKITYEQTPERRLTSKKGLTATVSVNRNLIDFLNSYPTFSINNDFTTRWAAYAITPIEKSVTDKLYPQLQKAIAGMSQSDAVNLILNWVQTAFVYEYDDKVWGHDRAFFPQETLYYPYCDCEDRSILFSRLIRDIMGLDVVLLYYPGHLATAVAFTDHVAGDYLEYKGRRYTICDPTYIGAPVGETMPKMNNSEAQVIVLGK